MKVFNCENCGQLIFFENTACFGCRQLLGFAPRQMRMQTFADEANDATLKRLTDLGRYRYCENYKLQACNWVIPLEENESFCKACQ